MIIDSDTETSSSGSGAGLAAAEEFLDPALAIGRRLAESARSLPDGSLTWGRGAGHDQQPVPDSGPFNGRVGEAVLFAALARVTGDPQWRRLAHRVVSAVARVARDRDAREELAREVSLGLSGLGGISFCLLRIGQLTGADELITAGREIARLLTADRLTGDYQHDVIWGNAGALLALLAHADAGADWALERSTVAAEHLLASRVADPQSGYRAWAVLRPGPSASFAHGASGIAHALLQLHRRRPDDAIYEAAIEAFDFERTLYREELDNWVDSHHEPNGAPLMWSWCHGAPGIALARLSALGVARPEDEAALAGDLRTALGSTLAARVPGVDTICCGYFGRIDIVHQAGFALGNESLLVNARQLARQRLHRAREKGGFLLNDVDETVEPHLYPGLWQDLGGSAYTLLRLAAPGRLPSLLAME